MKQADVHSPRPRSGSLQSRSAPVGLPGRRIQLSGSSDRGAVSFLSSLPSNIQLNDETTSSWVTLTRTGTWNHPRYGRFSITSHMLQEMVANFEADTYGQEISIDVGHVPDEGSAGRIVQLSIEGNRLRARIEWTPWGRKQVTEKGYRYFSVDFHDNWLDPETEREHGPVLFGAALTTRPFVKRLDPVELSEEFTPPAHRVYMHQELRRQLSEHVETLKMNWLKELERKLTELGLSKAVVTQLCESAKAAAKHLGEDQDALKALSDQFVNTGKSLAESVGDKDVKLSIEMPKAPAKGGKEGEGADAGTQLSEDKVGEIVAKQLAEAQRKADEQERKLAESLDARKKILSDVINAAEGLEDEQRKELTEEVEDLLTPDMPEDKVRKLAEYQVSQANKVAAARKLADLGYQDSRSGSPHITVDDQNTVKKLSDCIRENLAKTSSAQFGGLKLPKQDGPFVARVLAEFDRRHAPSYDREHKVLAGETSWDGNTDLPVGFKREVIREALSDLNILNLLQTMTDFQATTTVQIPYEERDGSAIVNDGIVHEGQGIPSAGISQKMDVAYTQAMKLAMNMTNEIMFFTRASAMNWDAFARNVQSNARFIRELLQRRIANELQRSADAYNAGNITGESIAAQLDGSTNTIKTAEFPDRAAAPGARHCRQRHRQRAEPDCHRLRRHPGDRLRRHGQPDRRHLLPGHRLQPGLHPAC